MSWQKGYIFLVVLLCWVDSFIFCQDLVTLTSDNGLSSNQTYSVVEGNNHFMWVLTKYSVDRYDGKAVKHYFLNTGHFNSLSRLEKLSNGSLVLYTNKSIFHYSPQMDRFDPYLPLLGDDLDFQTIHDVELDQEGRLWFSTNDQVFCYEDDSLLHQLSLPEKGYTQLRFHNSKLFLSSNNQISVFNEKAQHFAPYLELPNQINVRTFAVFDDFNFFIGSLKNGVFNYQKGQLKQHVPTDHRISKTILHDNKYYVSSDGGGIYVLDNGALKHYDNEKNPNLLSNDFIYDITINKDGLLWIATYHKGVNIINALDHKQKAAAVREFGFENIKGDVISSVYADDRFFIVGTEIGLSIFNSVKEEWKSVTIDPPRSQNNYPVTSISALTNGDLIVSLYGKGIYRVFAPGFERYERLDFNNQLRTYSRGFKTVFIDQDGFLWIGISGEDLVRYDLEKKEIRSFPIKSVNNIIQTRNGDLVMNNYQTIFLLSPATKTFQHFSVFADDGGNKSFNGLSDIYVDNDGILWFSSLESGLFYMDEQQVVRKYDFGADAIETSICSIEGDRNGRLWLSTNKGMAYINTRSNEIADLTYGSTSQEFKERLSYKAPDGDLIFGGFRGIVLIKPDAFNTNVPKNELLINDFFVLNEIVKPGQESFITQAINFTERLVLPFDQNSIGFSFSVPDFNPLSNILYQWKLDGYDEDWQALTDRNQTFYNMIPDGKYIFKVRAVDEKGKVIGKAKTVGITIQPPFWKTPLAIGMYVVLILVALLASLFYYSLMIKRRESLKKINFFNQIAHDIKTPLSLIVAPLHDLIDSDVTKEQGQKLELIESNTERILELTDQLVTFESVNPESLHLEKFELNALMCEIIQNFEPLLEKNKIEIVLHSDISYLLIYLDRDKLRRIIYNLVSNAIKYSYSQSRIDILVSNTKNKFKVQVRDFGMGIPKKQQKAIFNEYFRAVNAVNANISGSGIGLMLCRKLAKMMGGDLSFKSNTQETSFFLSLPMQVARPALTNEVESTLITQENDTNQIKERDSVSIENKKNLLVVEDSHDLRDYLKEELGKYFNVIVAENGEVAFNILKEQYVDAVISDFMMPVMDGFELCRNIRKDAKLQNLIFILITAISGDQFKVQGYEAGVDAYLEKPFKLKGLKARVDRLIQQRDLYLKEAHFISADDKKPTLKATEKREDHLTDKISAIINEHLDDPDFNVLELCKILGVSRPVLYRKVKQDTGYSLKEMIDVIRLNKAKHILKAGELNVSETAYKVGFSDPHYFSTAFKKHTGKTPSQYIESGSIIRS